MRTPLIAGNWKMNKTISETKDFLNALTVLEMPAERDVVLFVPATSLPVCQELLVNSRVHYGAQNMHWDTAGAFTGELSAAMLNEVGCIFVLLGHSERRQYYGETDDAVSKKVVTAVRSGMTPIICVGETLEQRQHGEMEGRIKVQVNAALFGLTEEERTRVIIAYEPIWAIGTGETASATQVQDVHIMIREIVGEEVRIIYGGSVNPENCAELMNQPDIDGALVGGASLEVGSFFEIVNY